MLKSAVFFDIFATKMESLIFYFYPMKVFVEEVFQCDRAMISIRLNTAIMFLDWKNLQFLGGNTGKSHPRRSRRRIDLASSCFDIRNKKIPNRFFLSKVGVKWVYHTPSSKIALTKIVSVSSKVAVSLFVRDNILDSKEVWNKDHFVTSSNTSTFSSIDISD